MSHLLDHELIFLEAFREPSLEMMRVLKFLAGITPDQAGLSFALPRTIHNGTGLSLHDIGVIIEEGERKGLIRTIRTNLSGPDGIISAMITEKGRSKVSA
jgi:hypothetical protein